jgi:hypothetical protein
MLGQRSCSASQSMNTRTRPSRLPDFWNSVSTSSASGAQRRKAATVLPMAVKLDTKTPLTRALPTERVEVPPSVDVPAGVPVVRPDAQQFGKTVTAPVTLDAKPAQHVSAPVAGDGLFMTSLPKPTHTGTQWVPQKLGEVRLNLGGEGEVQGFVNVNPMIGNQQSLEAILKRDPTGAVLDAGAEALPYPDKSVKEIRGNALPSPVLGRFGRQIAAEILRVLVPGGTAQFSSRTPFAKDLVDHLESLGFKMVGQNMARFTQP